MRKLLLIVLIPSMCHNLEEETVARRISKGKDAKYGQFPYFAQLEITTGTKSGAHDCGATLINPKWILTAAHCFPFETDARKKVKVVVYMGSNYRKRPKRSSVNNITKIIIHPKFMVTRDPETQMITMDNDVAIGKLKTPYKLSKYIQPVTLPLQNLKVNHTERCKRGTIIGIGATDFRPEKYSKYVQHAKVNAIPREKLEDEIQKPCVDTVFYTTVKRFKKAQSLKGDPGGPFVCKRKKRHVQYGIDSNFFMDTKDNKITIYEEVDRHIWFIAHYVTNLKTLKKVKKGRNRADYRLHEGKVGTAEVATIRGRSAAETASPSIIIFICVLLSLK